MDNTKIHVSCVSYLNSLPFLYGLKNPIINSDIVIELDHPSDCAHKLIKKEVDLGLIPVAAIPQIENHEIISEYCIGANGAVDSVVLLSHVPLNEIDTIVLDYQSITSVKLVRILCSKYWNIKPNFISSSPGFEKNISGNFAAVIIGDRAMNMKNNFNYVFDLSESWKSFSGLPFVFACWVSNKKLSREFQLKFNQALKFGVEHINEVIDSAVKTGKYEFNVKSYLTERLNFRLSVDAINGMNHFLELAKEFDSVMID